jgi:hypothetical protein
MADTKASPGPQKNTAAPATPSVRIFTQPVPSQTQANITRAIREGRASK